MSVRATDRGYDVVAVDVDGTLMDSSNEVRPAVRDALGRAHAAGVAVVLCTGRRFRTTMGARRALGEAADVVICSGGTLVKEVGSERTLASWPLARETARALCVGMREAGLVPIALPDAGEGDREVLLSEGDRMRLADGWRPYFEANADFVEFYAGDAPEREVVEVYTVDREDRVERGWSALAGRGPAGTRVLKMRQGRYGADQVAIEFVPEDVSKAAALAWLLERWGVGPERLVAIGDDVNDVEMVTLAGAGVAMGNAVAAVKEAAGLETADCDHDGVASALRALMPELWEGERV
jgi:hydroxymethylpyrimidine pyrophosphatase-like HAD family hydrolase